MNNLLLSLDIGSVTPPEDSFWGGTDESSIFGVGTLIQNVITTVYAISGLLLLAYLLYGSVKWIMAGGDSKSVQNAKDTVFNAVIGIVLLVASGFIVEIGTGILGVPSPFSISIPTLIP